MRQKDVSHFIAINTFLTEEITMNADLNYEQRKTLMKALRLYFEVTLDTMTYGETMTSDEQLNLGKEVMNTHKLILGLCIDPTLNS